MGIQTQSMPEKEGGWRKGQKRDIRRGDIGFPRADLHRRT